MASKHSDYIGRGRLLFWRWYQWRDATTGRYVTKGYATFHPSTTVRERALRSR